MTIITPPLPEVAAGCKHNRLIDIYISTQCLLTLTPLYHDVQVRVDLVDAQMRESIAPSVGKALDG